MKTYKTVERDANGIKDIYKAGCTQDATFWLATS